MSMRRPALEYWPDDDAADERAHRVGDVLHRDADVVRAVAIGLNDELRRAELVVAVDVGREPGRARARPCSFIACATSVSQSLPRTENSIG